MDGGGVGNKLLDPSAVYILTWERWCRPAPSAASLRMLSESSLLKSAEVEVFKWFEQKYLDSNNFVYYVVLGEMFPITLH